MVSPVKKIVAVSKKLYANRSGLAAVEFAIILPLMLLIFLGVVESSDGITQSRRVNLAVNTLVDLASQESELLTGDIDNLFDGVAQIAGADTTQMTLRLVSVIIDPTSGDPVVHWSRQDGGTEPYAPGSAYTKLPDNTAIDAGASVVVAEIIYPYSPSITHYVMPQTINFDEVAMRWPRRTMRVQLCTSFGNCTS